MKIADAEDLRELLLLALSRFSLRFLSSDKEEALARFVRDRVHTFVRKRRRQMAGSMAAALGDKIGPDEMETLTREVIRNKWVASFSISAIRRRGFSRNVAIDGLEHLDRALERGNGVVLWESDFGSRRLAKAVLAEKGYSLCQVHAPEHGASRTWLGQNILRAIHRRAESRLFVETIDVHHSSFVYLKLIVSWLYHNMVVCTNSLGREGAKFVTVEFMGVRLKIATGAISLARMTGATIIPIFCFRSFASGRRVLATKWS